MIKRGLLTGAVLMLLCSVAFSQNAKQLTKTGERFMEGGQYEAALEQFTRVAEISPNKPDGYLMKALALEKLGRHEEAYENLEKASVLDPKNVEVLIALGRAGNSLGKYDAAIVSLNRASGLSRRTYEIYPEKVETLIGLRRYDQALRVADTAQILSKKKTRSESEHLKGIVYVHLNNDVMAKREFEQAVRSDKNNSVARLDLAALLVREAEYAEALKQCNEVLKRDERNTRAFLERSKVYIAQLDFPSAINDISKNIVIEPEEPSHYLQRGMYYQQFNQHANAITDFTRFITLKDDDVNVYLARARSYESMLDYNRAKDDYNRVREIARYNEEANMALEQVTERLFELNREGDAPKVEIIAPVPINDALQVRGDADRMMIALRIEDQSDLKYMVLNGERIDLSEQGKVYEFTRTIDLDDLTAVAIEAADIYENINSINIDIRRTETNPPVISIVYPRAADGGIVFLPNNDPVQRFEGRINDESLIRSITIDGVSATFFQTDLNPVFSAQVTVQNKRSLTVEAEDIFGNKTTTEFTLSREGATLSESNPMGLTWAVFVENTSYTTFATLEGPTNDVELMKRALDNYEFHRVLHKKDMSKAEMERFFSIELRDLVRNNNVNSLLIWYAGHGVFVNDVGYWIPVDARRDDEFTYFNINALRAAMEPYAQMLTHLLVVTDACESGPGFYTAMRSSETNFDCGDWSITSSKSAQVVSSAGYELAVDNSQFTETFYNVLMSNPNSCVPINEIVTTVTETVSRMQNQKPLFGQITGLPHERGTFFFVQR
jgi:tetratricopeptide (TPR) repeat protein